MKKLNVIFYTVLFSLILATPAAADPVSAAFTFVVGAIKAISVVKIALTVALNVATSMIKKAMTKKPVPPGIKIERTLTGGTNSRSIILGTYATAGSHVCPPMSHGQDGKTPNAYLTQVIAAADYYTTALTGLILNGERVAINGPASEYGQGIGGKYAGKAWIKFYDGRQTTADAMLVSKYGGYMRPWSSDRIGKGVSYAILTFKFDRDLYKQEPESKLEVQGAPLYDIRFDSTAGGDGPQRWDDVTTHQPTTNPVVMIYNILRGIRLAGNQVYGGECSSDDLPVAVWAAAMNVCDEVTETGDKRYQAGYEIHVADEQPADVIEELLKACSGSISEVGGIYKIRVGPPALPVIFITDADILVSNERDFDPYPTIDGSINSVYAAFPHPGENWNTHDAPPQISAEYIAQDDGVEQAADLQFPAIPYPLQVQRNMLAWMNDDRRWRRHTMTMGPYSFALEPLDVIAWTSAHNGYESKLFEIGMQNLDLSRVNSTFAVREVDPDDYNWTPGDVLPDPVSPGSWELPDAQAVPGWSVLASSVKDDDGEDRRPALQCSWTADGADDAKLLKIEVRLAETQVKVADATVTNVSDGTVKVSEGILPNTSYEARAIYVVDRPTIWSSWIGVTTGNILFTEKDGVVRFPDGSAPIWNYPDAEALPVPPISSDQTIAFVEDEAKLYRWDASQNKWVKEVDGGDIDPGTLTNLAFAAGLQAPGLGPTLPALPDPEWPDGSMFVSTTDGKTYTNRGGTWSASIDASDIDGTIPTGIDYGPTLPATGSPDKLFHNTTDGKLYRWNAITGWTAEVASADLIGQIIAGQIADAAVIASKIAGGAVTTPAIAAGAITASKLFIGDTSNIFPDPDLIDASIWSNDSSAFTLFGTSVSQGSKNALALPASASTTIVRSSPMTVQGGHVFNVSAAVAYQGAVSVTSSIDFGINWFSMNASGALTFITNSIVEAAHRTATPTRYQSNVTAPANARVAVFWFRRSAGATDPQANLYGPIIRRATTGELVVDGAITTDKLSANAVTAGKISAGAVTTDKITAGAVQAAQIGAGAVTASKLFVGDTSNMVPDSAIVDPASWQFASANVAIVTASPDSTSKNRFNATPAAADVNIYSAWVPVEQGSELFFSAVMGYGSGTIGGGSYTYLQTGQDDGAGNVTGIANNAFAGPQTSATRAAFSTSIVVPTGHNVARIRFRRVTGGTATALFDSPIVRRMANGQLIVDGAITTDKLAANSVVAGKIAAGAVSASAIAAGAITASKLFVGDTSNMFPDPNLIDATIWGTTPDALIATPLPLASTNILRMFVSASNVAIQLSGANTIPVEGSQAYFVSTAAYVNNVDSQARLYIRWFSDAAGTSVISPDVLIGSTNSTSVVTISSQVTAPANARRMAFRYYRLGGGTGIANFGAPVARRATSGELVVDGAITTDKLAANAVTADKIIAGAVTAAKINVTNLAAISANLGSITAGSISVGAGGVTIQSAASGERTVLSGGRFEIYNSANQAVIQLGIY